MRNRAPFRMHDNRSLAGRIDGIYRHLYIYIYLFMSSVNRCEPFKMWWTSDCDVIMNFLSVYSDYEHGFWMSLCSAHYQESHHCFTWKTLDYVKPFTQIDIFIDFSIGLCFSCIYIDLLAFIPRELSDVNVSKFNINK